MYLSSSMMQTRQTAKNSPPPLITRQPSEILQSVSKIDLEAVPPIHKKSTLNQCSNFLSRQMKATNGQGATMLPANIKSPIESMKIMRSSHSVSFKIIFIHLDDYNIYSHSILLDSQKHFNFYQIYS